MNSDKSVDNDGKINNINSDESDDEIIIQNDYDDGKSNDINSGTSVDANSGKSGGVDDSKSNDMNSDKSDDYDEIQNDSDGKNVIENLNGFNESLKNKFPICEVCQKRIQNENEIYYYRNYSYHINCLKCRVCHKNLIKSDKSNEEEICTNDLVFIFPNFFFYVRMILKNIKINEILYQNDTKWNERTFCFL